MLQVKVTELGVRLDPEACPMKAYQALASNLYPLPLA
jgi:hypothetical protein